MGYSRNPFIVVILLLSTLPGASSAGTCTTGWESFSSKPYTQIAFPDTNVTYWRYRFEVPAAPIVLKVSGQYPYSRYVNYNIYDQSWIDSTASLPDLQIQADADSKNPFLAGAPRDAAVRNYTVWVGPKEVVKATPETPNTIEFPTRKPESDAKKPQAIELWYRIYLTDRNADTNGNVPLPKIEAFDPATGQPATCPAKKTSFPPILGASKNAPPKIPNGELHFFAADSRALYANRDNRYLITRFDFEAGPVAVIRFKAPSFPDTASGGGTFNADTEVRYWSLCVGGMTSQTSDCLADKDAIVGADGFVNVVIGPDDLKTEVQNRQLNFLPKSTFGTPVLIYRNLLTHEGFAGDIRKIPTWPPKDPAIRVEPSQIAAHKFIGDRAPKGKHCSLEEFRSRTCGLPVSYPDYLDDRRTSSAFSNRDDCRAIALNNPGLCRNRDCRGILYHAQSYCQSQDCRAIVLGNPAHCETRDCRAVVYGNPGLCESANCRAILYENSGLCR